MLLNNDTICKTMQTIAYSKKLSQAFGVNTMYMLRSVLYKMTGQLWVMVCLPTTIPSYA